MHQPRQNTPQVSIATRTARPTRSTNADQNHLDKTRLGNHRYSTNHNFSTTCSSIPRPLTRPPDHYGQFSISSRRLNRPSRPTLTNQKLKRQQQSSRLIKVAVTWRQGSKPKAQQSKSKVALKVLGFTCPKTPNRNKQVPKLTRSRKSN